MKRRARLVVAGVAALALTVVAALVAVGLTGDDSGDRASGAGSTTPQAPASGSRSAPPSPSAPRPSASSEPPRVRLPAPAADDDGGALVARDRARQRRREAAQRRALVPETPEVAPDSLECIEAIAQRRTMVAATFNIHGGFGRGRLRLGEIAREIERMDADVVLLQEVDRGRQRSRRQHQAAELARRLDMRVAYDPNSSRRSGGTIGNAVLSRFPITNVRRAPLPRGGAEPRGVMRVVLDVDNVAVAVYVTHLEHSSQRVRRRQMRYVAAAVRSEGLPHLVGGDLNARPGTDVLGIAQRVLRDAWPAAGRGGARTVPRARIDYLMHGPSLRPMRAQVVPSRVSDHDAVLGAFEVGAPQTCRRG